MSSSQRVPVQLAFPENEGETCVKPGHIKGTDTFVVKTASGFQKNRELGLSNSSGIITVFSAKTGVPEMVREKEKGRERARASERAKQC